LEQNRKERNFEQSGQPSAGKTGDVSKKAAQKAKTADV
jgi:hypothetical protein